jgi:hypothetical protein
MITRVLQYFFKGTMIIYHKDIFTYIICTLLKFPNSAGTDPVRWFLLKFLHLQLNVRQ